MRKLFSVLISLCLACVMLLSVCGCDSMNLAEMILETYPEEVYTEVATLPQSNLYGKVIVVDPGHGVTSASKKEQMAPGSQEMKAAYVSGTRGANQTEEQLNLAVGLKLRDELVKLGAKVYMTREVHECTVSNIDRAVFANNLNADISVKLHADGNNSSSPHGVSVLVPGGQYIKDAELIKESRTAAELVLKEFVAATGANNRGISVRNDMTGFNWSTVPVILIEMGFMTNPAEDARMETDDYQNKMVEGIISGLELYFE